MDFQSLPLIANIALFVAAAAVVWLCGWRISGYVGQISALSGIGQAYAGLLMLGALTSLPEIANVVTAAAIGNAALAVNSIFGSTSTNILLLALADAALGRQALTALVVQPTTLLQATLGIVILAMVTAALTAGEFEVFGVGLWSVAVIPLFLGSLRIVSHYENRRTWTPSDGEQEDPAKEEKKRAEGTDLRTLVIKTAIAGGLILASGFVLAQSADAIAEQTGLGSNIVGFVLAAFATSLPETSSLVSSVRRKNYELALGEAFGTNMFNLVLIPVADLVYRGGAILSEGGRFEIVAGLLGIVLTAIFIIGLLERRDRTFFRMGYDSLAAILVYALGLVMLWRVSSL